MTTRKASRADFKNKKWSERIQTLGDPAEQKFEAQYPNQFVRSGLNRPPFNLTELSDMVRYTPDYLKGDGYYEVQGCGRDQKFKFKHDKLRALMAWDDVMTTYVWLWNEPHDTWSCLEIQDLMGYCFDNGFRTDGIFDGSKPYAAVSVDELEWFPCRT